MGEELLPWDCPPGDLRDVLPFAFDPMQLPIILDNLDKQARHDKQQIMDELLSWHFPSGNLICNGL